MLPSENQINSKKKKFYLSIDLEDATYDLYRSLGIEPIINFSALDKSYGIISSFLKKNLGSKKITFFTTGTVALTHPKLIAKIANDGHEIACHYHYHDLMANQSIDDVEKNIIQAREAIKSACGYYPLGFRAPVFSIPKQREDIYILLAKYFEYDSSYIIHENEASKNPYLDEIPFNIKNFQEFPIITLRWLKKFNLKSGGTFFRVFGVKKIIEVLNISLKNDCIPLIYFHPYDFMHKFEFKVPLNIFLKNKSLIPGIILYLRQFQWFGIGNKSTLHKLKIILREFEHIGPMKG